MDEANELRYSVNANATRYYYFKDTQTINVFVEDQDKEFEYEELLSKLIPDLKVNAIIASGGKTALIKNFEEFGIVDKDNPDHPNIYIADGDFDRIVSPNNMVKDDHFIYLNAYNIECYYFNETACIKYAVGRLHCKYNDVRARIDYQNWYEMIISQSRALFLIYCYLQMNHPEVPNSGNSPYIFIDDKTGLEREGALVEYKKKLLIEYDIDIDSKIHDISEIEKQYCSLYGDEYWHLICGKFLLTSLKDYLCSKRVRPIRLEDLRWWLINHIETDSLEDLAKKIKMIVFKKNET